MNDEREQAIAEVAEAFRSFQRGGYGGQNPLIDAARKLADIENPPLPDEIEILVSRFPGRDGTDFPDGWGYLYGVDSNAVHVLEGTGFYRCRLTPLERIR